MMMRSMPPSTMRPTGIKPCSSFRVVKLVTSPTSVSQIMASSMSRSRSQSKSRSTSRSRSNDDYGSYNRRNERAIILLNDGDDAADDEFFGEQQRREGDDEDDDLLLVGEEKSDEIEEIVTTTFSSPYKVTITTSTKLTGIEGEENESSCSLTDTTATTTTSPSNTKTSSITTTAKYSRRNEMEIEHELISETLTSFLLTIKEQDILEKIMFRLQSTRSQHFQHMNNEINKTEKKLAKLSQYLPEGSPLPFVEVQVVELPKVTKKMLEEEITSQEERKLVICKQIVILLGQTLPTRDMIILLCDIIRGLGKKGTKGCTNEASSIPMSEHVGGGCKMLMEVLSRHRRNRYVVEAVASAIWHQSMNSINIYRFLKYGAKELLIRVMTLHGNDLMIAREGMGALANLLSGHDTTTGSTYSSNFDEEEQEEEEEKVNIHQGMVKYHQLDQFNCQQLLRLWWKHYRSDPVITENISLIFVNLCSEQSAMQELVGQCAIMVNTKDWYDLDGDVDYLGRHPTSTIVVAKTPTMMINGCDMIMHMLHYFHYNQRDFLMVAAICEVIQVLVSDCEKNEIYLSQQGQCREVLLTLLDEYASSMSLSSDAKKSEAIKAICNTLRTFDLSFSSQIVLNNACVAEPSNILIAVATQDNSFPKNRKLIASFDHGRLLALLLKIVRNQMKVFGMSLILAVAPLSISTTNSPQLQESPSSPKSQRSSSPTFVSFTRQIASSFSSLFSGNVNNTEVLQNESNAAATTIVSTHRGDHCDEDEDDDEDNSDEIRTDGSVLAKVLALLADLLAAGSIASSNSASSPIAAPGVEVSAQELLIQFVEEEHGCELLLSLLKQLPLFVDKEKDSIGSGNDIDNTIDAACRTLWSVACSSEQSRRSLLQIPSSTGTVSFSSACLEIFTDLLAQYFSKEAACYYQVRHSNDVVERLGCYQSLLLDLIAALRSIISTDTAAKELCRQSGTCIVLVESFGSRVCSDRVPTDEQDNDKSSEILAESLALISVLSTTIANQDAFSAAGFCPLLVQTLRLHAQNQTDKQASKAQSMSSIYRYVPTMAEEHQERQEETIIRRCCSIVASFANNEDCRLRLIDANACEVLQSVLGEEDVSNASCQFEDNYKPQQPSPGGSSTHTKASLALKRLQRQDSNSTSTTTVTTVSSIDSMDGSIKVTFSPDSKPANVQKKLFGKHHRTGGKKRQVSSPWEAAAPNPLMGCSCM